MGLIGRIREALRLGRVQASGYAYPASRFFGETAALPLGDVMMLYERDPACKASVDLLAAACVGMGFYTTVNEEYEKADEAKRVVDRFNEDVNLDGLLCDMARVLIACGNDFWLKVMPERLVELHRLPVDAVERIERSYFQSGLKLPFRVEGYRLRSGYGGGVLRREAVIHWRINCLGDSAYGTGILQVLLHTLTVNGDRRPAYAWMKSRIERVMPKIFEKYAGPDVLAYLPNASEETIRKFEKAIKERPEEGSWLFYTGRQEAKVYPVTIDPRSRFEYYLDHIINQFYLGCETPLPRLFSTPGFTEASANAALDLQNMLVKPIQRYIKRIVEREIFTPVLEQAGFNPAEAKVRLNWGTPETPEVVMADMLRAAELGLIRPEEFRKNAAKFGWELWEQEAQTRTETRP
ncbi:hypothetical protein H5T51_00455 [Candidatus Bathyarchaeota archaeon]|nr:hypothetical protein [Candidatus Bathyarchaeota archaeon]